MTSYGKCKQAILRQERATGKKNLLQRRAFNRLVGGKMKSEPEKWFNYKKHIPLKYYANIKNKKERKDAVRKIIQSRKDYKRKIYNNRGRVRSAEKKSSPHVLKAKKMYDLKSMKNLSRIHQKTGCSFKSLRKILKKGKGAFYSSGSRPNQSPDSWAYARLASSITGGPASRVDCKHLREGNCNQHVLRLASKQGCGNNATQRSATTACSKVPFDCNKKNKKLCRRLKKCQINNGSYFSIPRKFSRRECSQMKTKGFSQRSSCIYNK